MTRKSDKRPFYLSLRWRALLPVIVIVMLTALVGAYFLVNRAAQDEAATAERVLLQTTQSVVNRAGTLYERQRTEARRIAFTDGIATSLAAGDAGTLQAMLPALAAAGQLDAILIAADDGTESAGTLLADSGEYLLSASGLLSDFAALDAVLSDGIVGASGLLQSDSGLLLALAVPVQDDGRISGAVIVGQRLETVLTALQASAIAELALYAADGTSLAATVAVPPITSAQVDETLDGQSPLLAVVSLDTGRFRAAYVPFTYGGVPLGVLATFVPDTLATGFSARQMIAVFAAILTVVTLIAVFFGVDRTASRSDLVAHTASALAAGFDRARTGLSPDDEIGRAGAALDQYANRVVVREDWFRRQLQRQRRQNSYLLAVLQSLPDGVVVQDRDGSVIVMNDTARDLLGNLPDFKTDLERIEARLPQVWGQALAPGIYTLGDPQQIEHDGHIITLQAAAVLSTVNQRIGTVMLLRDITADVQAERARNALLDQLAQDIQAPLQTLAQTGAMNTQQMVGQFAREISRHAAALQKMIVDMREVTRYSPQHAAQMQRPLSAETLIYAVANDWRQIAQAANLELRIELTVTGHHILGDESRLRWAIGNLVDNAIKYTPSGGVVALELHEVKSGNLHLRVRDSGVGISRPDLDNLFMPFYRGTPRSPEGEVIQVPGMGQGLPLAQQIITAHGGQMKVKSREGVGTAVYIALPITSAESYALPLNLGAMEGETVMITSVRDQNAR